MSNWNRASQELVDESPTLFARIKAVQLIASREWDKGFLKSLCEQLAKGRTLSEKQVATLEKIEHRNSPEARIQRIQWENQWDDEKKKIVKICTEYYRTTGYFSDLCSRILSDESFIPSEKQFKAMCENKYAKKVLSATFDTPAFPVGSLVAFRTTAPWQVMTATQVGQALILRVNHIPVTSAAKGSKVYEVLPVGSSATHTVEERHLKKIRSAKKR